MDPLAALLDAPRARDAFLLRASMAPPWALRIQDEAALTVVAMTRGSSVWERAGEIFAVGTGDVVLLTGPTPYVVGDEAGRPPFAVVQPGNRPESPDGEPLSVPLTQGIRQWGNSADGPDEMLVGNYGQVGEAGRRLLAVLPETVVLRADEWHSPLVPLLLDEMSREEIGQASLLDRLLDALVVSAVRQWALSRGDAAPAWLDAGSDPVVARGAATAPRPPRRAVVAGVAGPPGRGVAGRAGPAVPRAGRRAADGLPDRLADGARGRPAARRHRARWPGSRATSATPARSRSATPSSGSTA